MITYPIEKGVPIPDPVSPRSTRDRVYPFRQMEVGDSFAVDRTDKLRVSVATSGYMQRSRERFVLRQMDDTVRVWRVA